MDRGDWQVTIHGVAESDTTEATQHAHNLSLALPYEGCKSPHYWEGPFHSKCRAMCRSSGPEISGGRWEPEMGEGEQGTQEHRGSSNRWPLHPRALLRTEQILETSVPKSKHQEYSWVISHYIKQIDLFISRSCKLQLFQEKTHRWIVWPEVSISWILLKQNQSSKTRNNRREKCGRATGNCPWSLM